MYKILIVGHGGFPKGVHEALSLIIGKQDFLDYKNLDENTDHDTFEKEVKSYIEANKNLLIFADLTGGAPHKICARLLHSKKLETQFIVSGAAFSFLVQVCLTINTTKESKVEEIYKMLEEALSESKDMARIMRFNK